MKNYFFTQKHVFQCHPDLIFKQNSNSFEISLHIHQYIFKHYINIMSKVELKKDIYIATG